MRSLSPLRYPGSKPNLAEYFKAFLRENLLWGTELVEPYAGSASLSLALLRSGAIAKAFLVERDPLLYAFWKQIKRNPDALCRKVRSVSVSLATWRRMQKFLKVDRPSDGDLLDLALACVFLNRTNFSGILSAKPIGGISQKSQYRIDCRFNRDTLIAGLQSVAELAPHMRVSFGDAISFMRSHAETFARRAAVVYVDPPYYLQGRKLYRYHYSDRDHERLARFLDASTFKWIVSYDNHPFIRRLFKKQVVVPIWLSYVVKQSRRVEELLISNCTLLPVEYVDAGPKRHPVIRGIVAAG